MIALITPGDYADWKNFDPGLHGLDRSYMYAWEPSMWKTVGQAWDNLQTALEELQW